MSDLRVAVPIDLPEHGGGGFRFLRNFLAYLDRSGIAHTSDAGAGADVVLANAWHVPPATLLRAIWSRPDVTIVHRVDGAAQDYGRDPAADRTQRRVNRLADLTIFQSEYCRWSTRAKFPVIAHDGPVIHNPVDVDVFRPDGARADLPPAGGPRVCGATWSTNPRKGAAVLLRLAAAMPAVQFVLVGRFEGVPALPNVYTTGVLDAAGVASVMRACDIFATFAESEACPNVVLEALATGLPVLYLDSGAARELVGDCGIAVTEATFAEALTRAMASRAELARCARARALDRFHPDRAFGAYLDAIEQARRRRATGRIARLTDAVRRLAGVT